MNKLSQNVLRGYFRKGEITREMAVEGIITAHELSRSLLCSESCVVPFNTQTRCQQLCVTMGPHIVRSGCQDCYSFLPVFCPSGTHTISILINKGVYTALRESHDVRISTALAGS